MKVGLHNVDYITNMSHELRVYADIEDAIDTSESFRSSAIIREDSILIPLINLGISKHTLNLTQQLAFIDYSYLFFKSFSRVLIDNIPDWKSQDSQKRCCYIGGSQAGDLEVECERAYLLVPTHSRLSSTHWYPDNTPYYKSNLDLKQVNNFWTTVDPVWEVINLFNESYLA